MSTPVEQIKERLSIIDVVGSYVQLEKAGRHFKGKSPFTNEKTPSFFVSPDRGMYYCFSSGKGGDMFTFIQEMEGVDFKGALKMLAERAHVELVPEDPKKRTERETLYAILEAATVYFTEQLAAHPDKKVYLEKRGVSESSVSKWRIGFVPEGWRNLKDHLTDRGFDEQMILRAGLIKRSEDGKSMYDVFRDRVMFPIADPSGRVVAFSGRAMSSDPALPKYVNSPETELYEKSYILFGYDKAKQSIRSHDFSLIVEGQFDLVLAHQAGFTNTVAISGTALSEHHTTLLERLSKRVVLALDADRAGINSVKRAAHIMLARGMDVKVAVLPEGKDPADLVAEDPKLLKEAVRNATTVIEFLITVHKEHSRDERAFGLAVRDEVLPFVVRIPNRIEREYFETVVATALGTTKDAVHYEVERIAQTLEEEAEKKHTPSDTEHTASHTRSGTGVDARPVSSVQPSMAGTYRIDELSRFIYGIVLWQEELQKHATDTVDFDVTEIAAALEEATGADAWRLLSDLGEPDKAKLIFEAEAYGAELKLSALLDEVHSCLNEIRERRLRQLLTDARSRLREAEVSKDEARIQEVLEECSLLQKRLSDAGSGLRE